jgi:hypothetical protein
MQLAQGEEKYAKTIDLKSWSEAVQVADVGVVYRNLKGTVGARGSVVGCSSMLQARRSRDRVPLRWIFSMYLIHKKALEFICKHAFFNWHGSVWSTAHLLDGHCDCEVIFVGDPKESGGQICAWLFTHHFNMFLYDVATSVDRLFLHYIMHREWWLLLS